MVGTGAATPDWAAGRRRASAFVFGLLPTVVLVASLTFAALNGRAYGIEFRGNLWEPAKRILAGQSPYELGRLEADVAGRGGDLGRGYIAQAVYPAPAHVAAVPFGLLPLPLAMALFVALSVAALAGALWLLGVRDYRCYGVVFLSYTTLHALILGGLTPLLVLALAAVWRFRNGVGSSVGLASAIAAKLFMLPVTGWLAATGRVRAAARTLLVALLLVVVGWSVIGFAGFRGYPHLLELDAKFHEGIGYSLRTAGMRVGMGATGALAVAVCIAGALLAASVPLARRGNDLGAFAVAVAASLSLSPIVWQQYFLLLLVPLAIARPRLSPAWALALAFWLLPRDSHQVPDLLLAWLTVAAVTIVAVRAGASAESRSPRPPMQARSKSAWAAPARVGEGR